MTLYVCTQCGFKTDAKDKMAGHETYHETGKRLTVRLIKAIPGLIFSAGDTPDFSEEYALALIKYGYAVKAYN